MHKPMTLALMILALLLLSNLALAQTPWPPKLESGQTWSLTLSAGGQQFRWNVQLGQATGTVFRASASGVDTRTAEVGYFAANAAEALVRDRLVFSFAAPSSPSSFAQGFICLIPQSGQGSVALAPGVVCTATLGAAQAGASGKAEPPLWLREARRVPQQGQTWKISAFLIGWSLSLDQAEADGFSGKASVSENPNREPIPAEWSFRLSYVGRTLRLDLVAGGATISCLLDDQMQNAVNGVLQGQANLLAQGKPGSQGQSSCRVTLP